MVATTDGLGQKLTSLPSVRPALESRRCLLIALKGLIAVARQRSRRRRWPQRLGVVASVRHRCVVIVTAKDRVVAVRHP